MGRKRAPGSTTPQWVYTNDSIVAALQATYPSAPPSDLRAQGVHEGPLPIGQPRLAGLAVEAGRTLTTKQIDTLDTIWEKATAKG